MYLISVKKLSINQPGPLSRKNEAFLDVDSLYFRRTRYILSNNLFKGFRWSFMAIALTLFDFWLFIKVYGKIRHRFLIVVKNGSIRVSFVIQTDPSMKMKHGSYLKQQLKLFQLKCVSFRFRPFKNHLYCIKSLKRHCHKFATSTRRFLIHF